MLKSLVAAMALISITISVCWSQVSENAATQNDVKSSDEGKKTDRQKFMRRKLSMVHDIVEGLAIEDFELIEQGGMELLEIAESATWKSTKDPYYRHYSANFEQAAKGLVDAAESESVEKATFAYVHVTFSCTACHQHVRDTLRVAR